ncbi:MAG: hypothetical protein KIT13_05825 [Burkholderiales bacterium]|nr:hypothetical protein [Burkholderiales bacterium]
MAQVLRWNPDATITVDPDFHALAHAHPVWSAMPAVKARRIFLASALGLILHLPRTGRSVSLAGAGAVS